MQHLKRHPSEGPARYHEAPFPSDEPSSGPLIQCIARDSLEVEDLALAFRVVANPVDLFLKFLSPAYNIVGRSGKYIGKEERKLPGLIRRISAGI